MTVWLLTIIYHGSTETYIMASRELAQEQLYQYVKENDGGGDEPPMDADHRDDIIASYFDKCSGEEAYTITEEDVLTEIEKIKED